MNEIDELKPFSTELRHCARCGQDHTTVLFKPFKRPVVDGDGTIWQYWALCPNTGDPVMLRHIDELKE